MFDKKYNDFKIENNVRVTENKAPTDESIRLLNEFEENAKENIVWKVDVDQNNLKAIGIAFRDNIMEDRAHFFIKFNLNGKEVVIDKKLKRVKFEEALSKKHGGFGNADIYNYFIKEISDLIAKYIILQDEEFKKSIEKIANS